MLELFIVVMELILSSLAKLVVLLGSSLLTFVVSAVALIHHALLAKKLALKQPIV